MEEVERNHVQIVVLWFYVKPKNVEIVANCLVCSHLVVVFVLYVDISIWQECPLVLNVTNHWIKHLLPCPRTSLVSQLLHHDDVIIKCCHYDVIVNFKYVLIQCISLIDLKDQIEGTELRSAKFDFKFGVKKRRRVHIAVSSTTSPPRYTVNLHGTTAEGDSPEYTFNETPEEFQHEKKKKSDKERHLGT